MHQIAPGIDMANHSFAPNATVRCDALDPRAASDVVHVAASKALQVNWVLLLHWSPGDLLNCLTQQRYAHDVKNSCAVCAIQGHDMTPDAASSVCSHQALCSLPCPAGASTARTRVRELKPPRTSVPRSRATSRGSTSSVLKTDPASSEFRHRSPLQASPPTANNRSRYSRSRGNLRRGFKVPAATASICCVSCLGLVRSA